jgi:hypothetical protein
MATTIHQFLQDVDAQTGINEPGDPMRHAALLKALSELKAHDNPTDDEEMPEFLNGFFSGYVLGRLRDELDEIIAASMS